MVQRLSRSSLSRMSSSFQTSYCNQRKLCLVSFRISGCRVLALVWFSPKNISGQVLLFLRCFASWKLSTHNQSSRIAARSQSTFGIRTTEGNIKRFISNSYTDYNFVSGNNDEAAAEMVGDVYVLHRQIDSRLAANRNKRIVMSNTHLKEPRQQVERASSIRL